MRPTSIWSSMLLFVLLLISGLSLIEAYCGTYEFTCVDDSSCIPHAWQCDGTPDCDDGSDEYQCPTATCDTETEFQCVSDGICYPRRWVCDGEQDCEDGSDEQNCHNSTCSPDQFSCGPTGPCIPSTWMCDTHPDCPNSQDEQGCSASCVAEEFQCNNTQCVTIRWRCDGDRDCTDGSDEFDCPPPTCPPGEFMCSGNTSRCIPDQWKCDGDRDCLDGSDEQPLNCPNPVSTDSPCTSLEFMCANTECILDNWRCDGEEDCLDKSDEIGCNTTCATTDFTCANGQCIAGNRECDGFQDCPDGSDEPEECRPVHECPEGEFDCTGDGTNCIAMSLTCNGINDCGMFEDEHRDVCNITDPCRTNNGGCDHGCVFDRHRHYCNCRPGYELAGDKSTCIDVDECNIVGACSQHCRNTIGSYQCRCVDGYVRDPLDHRHCRVVDTEPELLFSNRYDMRKIGLHTGDYHDMLHTLKAAIGLDFDYNANMVYYTDVALEQINMASLGNGQTNTSQPEVLVSTGVNTPDGLAIDWVHKNIYWTDTGMDTIEIMCLQSKHRKTLFNTQLDEPRAIVVDPRENQGWMYWTDWGNDAKIERAGMDGSHREIIVSSDIRWPNGLTIDYMLNRLYWVDAKLHLIGSSDFHGGNRQVIYSSSTYLKHPFAITVFEDWLYWSDWETESITRVRKFKDLEGKEEARTIVMGLQSPMDVRVFHPYKQPDGPNRCENNNGGCSHICLPTPMHTRSSAKLSCHCPNGMQLKQDKHTCEKATEVFPTVSTPEQSTSTVEGSTTDVSQITHHPPQSDQNVGKIAGIVVGIISALVLVTAVIGYFVYRSLMHRNIKSLNFDNPVYRKTTEDTFSLEKHQYQPSKTLPPTLEPLTTAPYEYV